MKTSMNRLWRLVARLERALLVAIMLTMPLLYGFSVVVNNVAPGLSRHFGWVEELTRFLMVWLVFLGLGYVLEKGRHVSMDLGHRLLPPGLLAITRRGIDTVGTGFCFYVAWLGWQFLERIIASGQVSNTLGLSMGWLYAALPIGMTLLGLRYLRFLIASRPSPT